MKKLCFFSILLVLYSLHASAQSIQVNEEPSVTQLMNHYIEVNRSTTTLDGWRIQLFATTDRSKLDEALKQFKYKFPDVPVDWVHNKPYYKVKAGAFTSKLEAMRLLYRLKTDFPSAFPVQDSTIKPAELIN